MPQYSSLTELDRKVILYSYEKKSKSNTPLPLDLFSDESRAYISTEGEFILWELEKRQLTEMEIIDHTWLIISKKNHSLLLRFQDEKQLSVSSLFDNVNSQGHWLLKHGILKIYFNYQDHEYDIQVIANNNRPVHSALQIVDDSCVDILKVLPVSDAVYGNALID
jgi:hypothetical protein